MRSTTLTVLALPLLVLSSPVSPRAASIQNSPSYAPFPVLCPPNLTIRRTSPAVRLNKDEAAYVQAKTVTSLGDWTSYLSGVGLQGLDVATFVPTAANAKAGVNVPVVGFAVSGGGTRAMLVGGGMLAALDNRNATVVASKVGILQLGQYLAGLSGGSWMTGSWSLSGFPTFESLRDEVWGLDSSLLGPDVQYPTMDADAAYSIKIKAAAGYPVSFNDAYGRLISYHLTNDSQPAVSSVTAGPGSRTLWSSIKAQARFVQKLAPFPIIISLGRADGQINITLTSPIYESTPYEFGTDDPTVSPGAFVPMEYLGTRFSNAKPSNPLICVKGFENAGFLMGSSGDIFGNPAQLAGNTAGQSAVVDSPAISSALGVIPDGKADTARIPNPFLGLSPSTFAASSNPDLGLADGGLAGENIPFFPLIQPQRALDVIVAVDASADTNNFPDGQEIYHTYQKSLLPGYGAFPFPVIPEPVSFQAQGLNKKPVFFGTACTGQMPKTPLIVYLPNYNVNYATNTSTFTNSYTPQQQQSFFDNSYAIATQSNSSAWSTCLACALVDAQQTRNGATRSAECGACFTKYCYNP